MWKSILITSALDATPAAGSGVEHSSASVSCAKHARHLARRARRVLCASLVRRLYVPPRFVQWKLWIAAWARLQIDCQPAVCELFAGCALERPSVDLIRRERDGHLNCSTETLITILGASNRANFYDREHILN